MNRQRSATVWAAIRAHVDGAVRPLSLDVVCAVAVQMLDAAGAAVALSGGLTGYEPVSASGPSAQPVADLHATLGEGPALSALSDQRPVLTSDLAAADAQGRWPMFSPAALAAGVRAMFVFPLQLGAISLGVLEISRAATGWLTAEQAVDALVFADAALLLHLRNAYGDGAEHVVEPGRELLDRWAAVHQATGMIAVQANTDLSGAFVRLRAHAFAHERSLLDIAHDVVARRLRFQPDSR
ncbi:GAF and ANTAR domain-containing protein [Streptosporangiaceae bacterium NEAU-GS5]|nr:GAF and ANTAR domain-containing protein [Streptosporangiaceae bacterium NEAU-GS5]